MVFPDYQRVDDPEINKFFENFWKTKLDKNPGLTVVEIMDEVIEKKLNRPICYGRKSSYV
jgi:formate dehydrogenase major subunit